MLYSIVTVNFNNLEGLKKTHRSMQHQNISRADFEHIVIDGGSTDGFQEYIFEHGKDFDVIVSEKDAGIFDAMNKGIAIAKGQFVFFLNSGDSFSSCSVLSNVRDVIASYPDDKLFCGKVNTYIQGEYLREANLNPWICHQSAFLSVDLAKKYRFDSNLKVFGDLDMWFRLNLNGDYNPIFFDELVCDMEMDGVGNCPSLFKYRVKDKIQFNLKHNLNSRLFLDDLCMRLGYVYYRIFGLRSYHRHFIGFILYVKNKVFK
ncbi:glycosyltransferase [Vibrio diabolicus]|uniref:glycosyltransferase n=1 Tax=Vibrio diabolicus TaxID=50719 RepID=UPI00293FCD70|nr:glycosyltransferase [Vibrio diabolicus]MDV5037620.1 glycosyltransferase [Vibrio diabolicus]